MSTAKQTVTVSILDKDYSILCSTAESESLRIAARHLDLKMQAIRSSGKVVGLERVAIMAALNITHELIQANEGRDQYEKSITGAIDSLIEQAEAVLS